MASLHFDDLDATEEIENTWERYAAGTLIALEWAAENDDIDSAHNVLGVSLHAVQDFYAHSTWINAPPRRGYTYFQTPLARRTAMTLGTGAYERTHGPVQHGQYNFACSAFGGDLEPLQVSLRALCSSAAPTANLEFCEKSRACAQAPQDATTVSVLGKRTHVAVLEPPGIAMDTTWLSRIGGEQRGLTGPAGMSVRASGDAGGPAIRPGTNMGQVNKG